MRSILWAASVLVTAVLAAPPYSAEAGDSDALSQYFQLLAVKVRSTQDAAAAPSCDLSQAQMPSNTLPQPTGLTLKHVAIGRGTQNYTCSPNNAAAKPVQIGAKATLFNASCIAATNGDLLSKIPNFALQFNVPNGDNPTTATPTNLDVSGYHYFTDSTTPFFDLDTASMQLGQAACSKNATMAAPAGSPIGQGNVGYGSVAWLQLLTKNGATGKLVEVYRVNTAGGSPPANCSNSPAQFEVQYSAEYWFYESS